MRYYLPALLIVLLTFPLCAADILGDNLAPNPGFETAAENGMPVDWTVSDNPRGSAKAGSDTAVMLAGKASWRIEVPDTGGASLRSKPFPVEAGKQYLFSVGFRSQGFGPVGKYSGVSAYMGLDWLDAAGKLIARHSGPGFPYHPLDWDLRDVFVTAPAGATQVAITGGISNQSRETIKQNIPSTLWLDAMQFRPYLPPLTPAWALEPPQRIVEGGWDTSRVLMPALGSLNMAGGKWSPIVPEEGSAFGTVLTSPEGVGRGIMAHTPYYMNPRLGLYRAIIRCKVADITRKEAAGSLDVDTQYASQRGIVSFFPRDFPAPNTYRDFTMDFTLRTPGYWDFRLFTEGNQPFTVDSVRVFQLLPFNDTVLLDLYPGSDGVVPANLRPRRDGPFTGLLVAGLYYDLFRAIDAFHLAGYDAKLTTSWVQKANNQNFPGFPDTPEALFAYRVVCLCDVDAAGLTLRQKRMLVEYVRRGGGLVLLGGHKSFGRGNIAGSLLEEMLPVACAGGELPPFRMAPDGLPLVKGAPHPLTEFLDLSAAPQAYVVHEAPIRDGAQVILKAGDFPAVVLGRFGEGRVACVLLTPFGDPAEGKLAFWNWPAWPLFLRDLNWWTAGEERF